MNTDATKVKQNIPEEMSRVSEWSFRLNPEPARLRRAVQTIVAAGLQLDPSALEILESVDTSEDLDSLATSIVNRAREQKQWMVTSEIIKTLIQSPRAQLPSIAFEAISKRMEARLDIVRDPAKEIGSAASLEDFSSYFRDRFQKLTSVLRKRMDVRDARSLGDALEYGQNQKVKFIAMVLEKRERGTRIFLQIDDLEDTATVVVSRDDNRQAFETAQMLPLDQVVCIEAIRSRGDLFIGQRIVLPDVPERIPKGAEEEVYAVLLSDTHIGSKNFLSTQLQRVIDWLNGRVGDSGQRDIASRAKYLVIGGDLVDGIGVYPGQEEELAIPDIYEQYRVAAEYVSQIPDWLEVIMIPGNHDAVRQALPQPPVMKDFAEPVYVSRSLVSLGNPAEVRLHGVHFLLHHGRSLDDIIATFPGMSFANPVKAMELQLRWRHLAPEYGKRTSIAPEKADHLVVETPPDVFQSGHVHVAEQSRYRGTLIVNSGAWQSQTEYQRRMGLNPTPAILPVINLQTLTVQMLDFGG